MKKYLASRGIGDGVINELGITANSTSINFGPMYKTKDQPVKLQKGSRTALYGWTDLVNSSSKVVITEGVWDALSLQSLPNPIPALTNTTGVMSTLKAMQNEFQHLTDKNIYFLFDYDPAGFKALKKVWQYFKGNDKVRYCYFVPEDNLKIKGDVNDYIIKLHKDIRVVLNRSHSWEDLEGKTMFGVHFINTEPPEPLQQFKRPATFSTDYTDKLHRAKEVPFTRIAKFDSFNRTQCPNHNDKHASLQLYPDTNSCYCWACDFYCDTVKYIEKTQKKSFKEAVDELAPAPTIEVNGTIMKNYEN